MGKTRQRESFVAEYCFHCDTEAKARRREFTLHSWQRLVDEGTVDDRKVGAPICEPCYLDLRDILIDAHLEHRPGVSPTRLTP